MVSKRDFPNIINLYRGTMIKAENFEGFKEDNEVMKRWPLRAWTDSAYRLFSMRLTHYSQSYIQLVSQYDQSQSE